MKREARDRTLDAPKPVQKVELSEKNKMIRIVLAVLAAAAAVTAAVVFVLHVITPDTGWTRIRSDSSEDICNFDELVLYYNVSGTAESKAVTRLYTDTGVAAYRAFSADTLFENVHNLCYLNVHPNQTVVVDGLLYQALERARAAGDRQIFYAPVYRFMRALCASQTDADAAEFDPRRNAEAADFIARAAGYARDPAHVDVRLMGENKVFLFLSGEYRAFLDANNIRDYLDFGALTNALSVDAIADALTAAGFVKGSLTSSDGFTRCLDATGYSFNLFDGTDGVLRVVGVCERTGPYALVNLRTYAINPSEQRLHYVYADGATASLVVNADGVCTASTDNLYALSDTLSCADLYYAATPSFTAETFTPPDVDAIWYPNGGTPRTNFDAAIRN